MQRSKLKKPEIEEMFARFRQAEPEPKGELVADNPFTLLVAVVLSAQATDESVNRATPALFRIADTPARMADLGEDGIAPFIRTIGLYRTKARNVANLARILSDQYGGEVPMDREALQALPGVGRKTANVVLNMAFGQETFAVDTHVFRVSNRTGLAPGKTPDAVEAALDLRIPAGYRLHAHHWLILHGRYVCKARRPECWRCLIADLCKFEAKELNDPSASPSPDKRSTRSKTPA
jgi:endonuclease-3